MAKERNSKPANFSVSKSGSGDGGSGGRGSVGRVIGPKTATSAISNGGSLNRGSVGPGGGKFNHLGRAPYHEKGYAGSVTKDQTRKPV